MNIRTICIALTTLLPAAALLARDKTDVIILDNGDRLTGEIKALKAGVLYLSLDYVDGTIAVQWSKVASLESRQLFIVQMRDGSLRTGSLAALERRKAGPMVVQITEDTGGKMALERSSIVSLAETSQNFWRRFSGGIDVGVIQSKGNDSVQYNIGSEVEYRRERWGAKSSFNSNLSSSSGSAASTRNQLSLGAYHFLDGGNYFYGGVGNILRSSVQKISLQSSLGVGIGRYLKNTNQTRISLLSGLAWQATDYASTTVPLRTQNAAAGLLAADLAFFKFKKTNLSVTASLFPAFSNPSRGRIYFNTNASYYVKIFGNLSWTLSFYGNWDSRPPGKLPGSDYGSSSGLNWTFGSR
jgi:Protein of unknown function, DUF481